MSIDKKSDTPAAAPSQPAPQARTYAGEGSTTTPQRPRPTGLDGVRRPVFARGGIGETTHKVAAHIKKRIEEAGPDGESYDVQILDNERGRNYFSVVTISKGIRKGNDAYVAVYGFLIEGSAKKLPPRTFTYNNQAHSLPTAADDAVDNDLFDLIVSQVQQSYGPETVVSVVGVQVLPTEFQLAEDGSNIDGLLFNASQALATELVKGGLVDEQAVDARLIAQGGQPIVGRDTNPPPLTDNVGLPVRSDLSISLRQIVDQNQNVWKPNANVQPDLARLEGYVDLDYHEPQLHQANPYAPINPQIALQRYIPRFVITRLEVLTKVITPELALTALALAPFAGHNNAWLEQFRPRPTRRKDEVNLRDISAIGYEVNLTGGTEPERLPLPGASDIGKFYQMLALAIKPELLISIDIDEAGEQSWLLQDLYAAARGDRTAIGNLIVAANRLTDGNFGQMWNQADLIAVDEDNRIARGYWTDSSGNHRDLRELDYVAMLNLVGDKSIERLQDWSKTFYNNSGEPLDVRLERRDQIEREVLPSRTLKGWARRITINPKFLITLANAMAQAGLLPRPSDGITDLTGQTIRGNYTTADMAVNFNQAGVNYFSAGRVGANGFNGLGAAPMRHAGFRQSF